ncbi:MAG: phosphoribosylformylglycinamidine cyclo-ligase [Clostridiales bacterium]|nr:phosphoribosylformylglycinamidine cyclo-ligase [Clostridiales bacterium]
MKSNSERYKAAGVDINAGYRAVELMKDSVARTRIPGVLSGLGGFGGLFAPDLSGMKKPVLVSGTDGVGTKLKLAFLMDRHETIGIDCVAMCVNDIICAGAKPLFFLDYVAVGRNVPEKVAAIVSGVAEGCVQAGCALIGGETAEMPGLYAENEYDLAGFAVGIVDEEKMLNPDSAQAGDVLIALPSSGLHSNGFSLARKVLNVEQADLTKPVDFLGESLGEALLRPTRIYVKPALAAMESAAVRSIAHITGGGFYENLPRALTPGLCAAVDKKSLPRLPIFELIAKTGGIPEEEMYATFNMGVGLCLVVPNLEADKALNALKNAGEAPFIMGEVRTGEDGVTFC